MPNNGRLTPVEKFIKAAAEGNHGKLSQLVSPLANRDLHRVLMAGISDRYTCSAFILAAQNGHHESLLVLVNAAIDLQDGNETLRAMLMAGENHCAAFKVAAQNGHHESLLVLASAARKLSEDALTRMLMAGRQNLDDACSCYALILAARNSKYEAVSVLLFLATQLFIANPDNSVLSSLLQAGAHINQFMTHLAQQFKYEVALQIMGCDDAERQGKMLSQATDPGTALYQFFNTHQRPFSLGDCQTLKRFREVSQHFQLHNNSTQESGVLERAEAVEQSNFSAVINSQVNWLMDRPQRSLRGWTEVQGDDRISLSTELDSYSRSMTR